MQKKQSKDEQERIDAMHVIFRKVGLMSSFQDEAIDNDEEDNDTTTYAESVAESRVDIPTEAHSNKFYGRAPIQSGEATVVPHQPVPALPFSATQAENTTEHPKREHKRPEKQRITGSDYRRLMREKRSANEQSRIDAMHSVFRRVGLMSEYHDEATVGNDDAGTRTDEAMQIGDDVTLEPRSFEPSPTVVETQKDTSTGPKPIRTTIVADETRNGSSGTQMLPRVELRHVRRAPAPAASESVTQVQGNNTAPFRREHKQPDKPRITGASYRKRMAERRSAKEQARIDAMHDTFRRVGLMSEYHEEAVVDEGYPNDTFVNDDTNEKPSTRLERAAPPSSLPYPSLIDFPETEEIPTVTGGTFSPDHEGAQLKPDPIIEAASPVDEKKNGMSFVNFYSRFTPSRKEVESRPEIVLEQTEMKQVLSDSSYRKALALRRGPEEQARMDRMHDIFRKVGLMPVFHHEDGIDDSDEGKRNGKMDTLKHHKRPDVPNEDSSHRSSSDTTEATEFSAVTGTTVPDVEKTQPKEKAMISFATFYSRILSDRTSSERRRIEAIQEQFQRVGLMGRKATTANASMHAYYQ